MPQGSPWITSAGNIDKLLKRQLLGAKNIPREQNLLLVVRRYGPSRRVDGSHLVMRRQRSVQQLPGNGKCILRDLLRKRVDKGIREAATSLPKPQPWPGNSASLCAGCESLKICFQRVRGVNGRICGFTYKYK